MRPSRINVMTFTVFMAALTTIFSFIPGVSLFFAPLPIALAYGRHGLQTALTTTALAMLVRLLLSGPVGGANFLLLTALGALAFGFGVRHKLRPVVTGAAMTTAALLGIVGWYGVLVFTTKTDLVSMNRQMLEMLIPDPAKMGQAFQQGYQVLYGGQPREQLLATMTSMMGLLLPASLTMQALFSSVLAYSAGRWVLPRVGQEVQPMTPFAEWRVPRWTSWVVLLCMAVLAPALVGKGAIGPIGRMAVNVLVVLAIIYLVQGFAVGYHWLRKSMAKGAALAVLIVPFFWLSSYWLLGLAFLGMWDTALDLRKLGAQPVGPAPEPPARDQEPPDPEE